MCHVLENSFMNGFNKLGDFGGSRGLDKNLGGLAEPPRSCRKKRVMNGAPMVWVGSSHPPGPERRARPVAALSSMSVCHYKGRVKTEWFVGVSA
jgi:hypothetical protein